MIGTENANNGNFIAGTEAEENLMLMGKVNALRGIWSVMPEQINAKIVNAIFGFSDEPEYVTDLRNDMECYKKWYYDELSTSNKLKKEKAELENKLAEKEEQ